MVKLENDIFSLVLEKIRSNVEEYYTDNLYLAINGKYKFVK